MKDAAIHRILVARVDEPKLVIVVFTIARQSRNLKYTALFLLIPNDDGICIGRAVES